MKNKSIKVDIATPKPPAKVFQVLHVTCDHSREVRLLLSDAIKITETSVWLWNGYQSKRVARITDYGASEYFDLRTEAQRAHDFAKKRLAIWKEHLKKQKKRADEADARLKAFKKNGYKVKDES